jgi:hypothetical protein
VVGAVHLKPPWAIEVNRRYLVRQRVNVLPLSRSNEPISPDHRIFISLPDWLSVALLTLPNYFGRRSEVLDRDAREFP